MKKNGTELKNLVLVPLEAGKKVNICVAAEHRWTRYSLKLTAVHFNASKKQKCLTFGTFNNFRRKNRQSGRFLYGF